MSDDPYDKHLQRIRKLIARAGSTDFPAERETAVRMACDYLQAHPAPIRWLVRPGTPVRVVPTPLMVDLTQVAKALRVQPNRNALWLQEVHRVKGDDERAIGGAGFLQFDRFGYTLFVPLHALEAHL